MTSTATAPAKDDTVADPPYRGTRLHSMRIPDDVWTPAVDRAANEGETVTAAVVAFLRAYGAGERHVLPARKPGK